mmetsp:Transcript_33682/g.73708  ORF Transcript_33682/g.73708 Transcript_33682/m.73708 type:complete len:243 (-) Transcript_33682:375-1103(-)
MGPLRASELGLRSGRPEVQERLSGPPPDKGPVLLFAPSGGAERVATGGSPKESDGIAIGPGAQMVVAAHVRLPCKLALEHALQVAGAGGHVHGKVYSWTTALLLGIQVCIVDLQASESFTVNPDAAVCILVVEPIGQVGLVVLVEDALDEVCAHEVTRTRSVGRVVRLIVHSRILPPFPPQERLILHHHVACIGVLLLVLSLQLQQWHQPVEVGIGVIIKLHGIARSASQGKPAEEGDGLID